jgi:hypothetical protein
VFTNRNVPIYNHPLVGSNPRTYRADLPAYDKAADTEGGTLIIGHGMLVGIKAVFQNWNAQPGLDMLYVYCFETGYHTHVTPFDVGLKMLDPDTAMTEPFGDDLLVERRDGVYFMGDDDLLAAAKVLMRDEYGDDITEQRIAVGHPDNDTWKYIVSEHRGGDVESPNQWGSGFTSDEAWRYLIGADFGPIDSEYNEGTLRITLAEVSAR